MFFQFAVEKEEGEGEAGSLSDCVDASEQKKVSISVSSWQVAGIVLVSDTSSSSIPHMTGLMSSSPFSSGDRRG